MSWMDRIDDDEKQDSQACCYLVWYPRPEYVVYDNGSEFIQWEFQEMLNSYGITPVPTTVKNPQANSVIECLH